MVHSMSSARAVLTLAFVVASAEHAAAQYGPPPPTQLFYRSTTAARLNPLGLFTNLKMTYRVRLFQTNSIFTRDNFVGFGMNAGASPAFGRVAPYVEVQPVPMVNLWAMYEFVGYFGSFEFLNSYSSPNENFSDAAQDDILDRGENYSARGGQLTIGLTLQMKVGPVAIRSQGRLVRPDFNLRNGDRYFYDPLYDALIQDEGWFLQNDIDLAYIHQNRWTAAIRYTMVRPFYSGVDDHNNQVDRLGFILAWTKFREYKARFNGPTVLLLAQWHVRHQWRDGDTDEPSRFLPYLAIAFDFRGDLLAGPRQEPVEPPPIRPLPPREPEPIDEPEASTDADANGQLSDETETEHATEQPDIESGVNAEGEADSSQTESVSPEADSDAETEPETDSTEADPEAG